MNVPWKKEKGENKQKSKKNKKVFDFLKSCMTTTKYLLFVE